MNSKYIFSFFIGFFFLSCCIAGFNIIVDPLGNNGVISQKYKPIYNERTQKYNAIIKDEGYKKYSRYLLGSSRILNIHLDDKPFLKDLYNFGISGGINQQKFFVLEELCKKQPPEVVYFQIRFENFIEKPWESPKDFANHFVDDPSSKLSFLLNSQLVKLSVRTLGYAAKDRKIAYLNKDGSITYREKENKIKTNGFDFSNKRFITSALEWKPRGTNYAIESFQKIKDLADKYKVKLVPFIVPEHGALFTYLMNSSRRDEYLQARRDLIDIFGWYYDFCGTHPVNMDNTNYYDSAHYRVNVGDMILGRILEREDMQEEGYGMKITADNVEEHIKNLQKEAVNSSFQQEVVAATKKMTNKE
ncbi:MAG: hypothetical protein ACNI27_16535 [Desulfovibrio sp.]